MMPRPLNLTPLEQSYWDQFMALFSKVDPQKPEVGCQVMIERARKFSEAQNTSLAETLANLYAEAYERTERRLQITKNCKLK